MAESVAAPSVRPLGRRASVPPLDARPPVLVTGAHRSGTTWVGQLLAQAPGVHYIHEPFSVSDAPGPGICAARFRHWFTYVCRENEAAYLEPLRKTLSLEYDLRAAGGAGIGPMDLPRIAAEYRAFRRQRRAGARALVKDPLAFFSAAWLAERFGARVVVLIRHPAAFASSLQRLGWSHPFSHFLDQPLLMRDVLLPFEEELRRFAAGSPEVLDQAILLWRMIYRTVLRYRERHPDWIFVRHEDLSRDPVAAFRDLFARLGLAFSPAAEAQVLEHCGAGNPVDPEVMIGSEAALRRDSRRNLDNWRVRLTAAEVRRVREGTADVASSFYSDADW